MKNKFAQWIFLFAFVSVTGPLSWAHEQAPDEILKQIRIDPKFNQTIPLDLTFRDESGQSVPLNRYFAGKPVLLSLVYFECPMLCTVTLNELAGALKIMKLTPGKDFEILSVSINPAETPALAKDKKKVYLDVLDRQEAENGWHFLTGTEQNIRALTDSVGFHYVYDEKRKQFAHPVGLIVLTPKGVISKYFYDIELSAKDVQLALVQASEGKIGSPADQILLYCYHYDPKTGKYGVAIMSLIRLAGILTVLILGAFIAIMVMMEKRRNRGGGRRA